MVLLGLNAWQSLAVVAAGNLFWLLVGWLSVSGPSAGTPSEVITRAMYGVRGNRVQRLVHLAPARRVHRARLLRAGARELGLPGSGAGGGARRGSVGGRRGRLHIIASAPLSWGSGIAASRCSTTVRHRLSRPRVGRWHPRISSGAGPGSSPPSRPRLAPAGPRIRPLPAEAVEFPVPDAAEKGVPLIRGEPQDRPRGIPAVTNADLAPGQARHLDAVAVGVAQRALDPVRTRTRPFASAAERSACHVTSSLRGLFYLKCATSQPEMRARNTWPYR